MKKSSYVISSFAFIIICIAIVLLEYSFVFAETMGTFNSHKVVTQQPGTTSRGEMVDDYWVVEQIAPRTFAIGEPRYYQQNYAYLILGTKRALLFDAGSGTRNIGPVIARLTRLPVTILPSHLHYDHLGGISAFRSIAMIDVAETRTDDHDGWFEPSRYEYLGMIDHLVTPHFHVTEWIKPGTWIDLGGRKVQLLSTPGHTPSSASLFDPSYKQVFAGDFMYPGPLYAQLPGASRSAYLATASTLLATLPPRTTIWSAHCCRSGSGIRAPWLEMSDLAALRGALELIARGEGVPHGFYPRIFPVNDQMTLLTGFPWTNR